MLINGNTNGLDTIGYAAFGSCDTLKEIYNKTLSIEKKNIESWYKRENIYYHGGTGEYMINIPDNKNQ